MRLAHAFRACCNLPGSWRWAATSLRSLLGPPAAAQLNPAAPGVFVNSDEFVRKAFQAALAELGPLLGEMSSFTSSIPRPSLGRLRRPLAVRAVAKAEKRRFFCLFSFYLLLRPVFKLFFYILNRLNLIFTRRLSFSHLLSRPHFSSNFSYFSSISHIFLTFIFLFLFYFSFSILFFFLKRKKRKSQWVWFKKVIDYFRGNGCPF